MENVIIIGSGCAGSTAAIYTGRAGLNPLVIEGKQPGGQLTTTSEVENFPGFPEGIDGYELTSHMRKQAERFGARYTSATINRVELSEDKKILYSGDTAYETKTLIIASGAAPRFLGIPGEQELFGGKGVTTCATCDGAFYRNMDVVVIGGGDSACEEALFLTHFCSKVYLIHRRDSLRASKIMAQRVLENKKIQMVWNAAPTEVLGVKEGSVYGIKIKNTQTAEESIIDCKGVFLAIGHLPNTAPFQGILDLDEAGYFVPSPNSQVLTKIPGVYVCGDCVDHVYRQAITAAGMGCQAAIEAERWLSSVAH